MLKSVFGIGFHNGVPTAPTASVGTNNTDIATTAFVLANAGAGGVQLGDSPTWTGIHTFSPTARTSGSAAYFTINAPADTALTASTEAIGINYVGAIRQHATGAITTQRERVFGAPTYSFVGASTITTAIGNDFASPIVGTNATLTNSYAARFVASAAAHVPLVAQGATSQSGDLQQWQSSTGTVLTKVTSAGSVQVGGLAILTSSTIGISGGGGLYLNGNAGELVPFVASDTVHGSPNTNNIGRSNLRWGTLFCVQGKLLSNFDEIVLTIQRTTSPTNPHISLQTSAGGSLGNISGGCIGDVIANVSTTHTDGTFDTLRTDTTVANALIVNGDKIWFDYTLTVATHTTNTAELKLAFASVTIFDSGAITFAVAGTVRITGYIIRVTSTTCRATVMMELFGSATLIQSSMCTYTPDGTLTGLTLTGTNSLVLSAAAAGTGAASGDVALVQATIGIMGFGS